MTRGGDGLMYRLNIDLGGLRDNLACYLEDVDGGWYDTLTKEDFIERVRIALDDLDESELGAMYDQYIKEPEDENSSCEFCSGEDFHHSVECFVGDTDG